LKTYSVQKPSSKLFDFQELLSENNLCQSWKAVNVDSGEFCLVKTPSATSDIGPIAGKAILNESFRCQKNIRSSLVLRARAKHFVFGNFFVEYPYLDPTDWTALTPDLLLQHFQSVLPQIGIAIDYVHTLGLVHCDLKLENFLIRVGGAFPRVVLMDLDFLCLENSDPEGKVLGTPDHIAPEIVANDRIVIQSDIYSLGISLGDWLNKIKTSSPGGASPDTLGDERLGQLVKELTQTDHLRRPGYLLEALYRHHLLDRSTFESSQKSLLAMLLVSRFRTAGYGRLNSQRELNRFLHKENKILGLGDELVGGLAASFAADRIKALSIFKRILRDAKVERHADYWHLGLDDIHRLSFYADLAEASEADIAVLRTDDSLGPEPEVILDDVRRLTSNGHAEYAFLYLKEYQQQVRQRQSELSDGKAKELLTELVALARSLNRLTEADRYLETLVELRMRGGANAAETIYDRVNVNVMLNRLDVADQLIETCLPKLSSVLDTRLKISFLRLKAWVLQSHGKHDQAMNILEEILSQAREHQFHEQAILILYNIGVLYWRRGDFRQSDKLLFESYELAEREDLLTQAVSVISTMSLLAFEQADYAKSIKYGKLASKIGTAPEHRSSLPSIFSSIANAHIRLADFPKADYWQQRYLSLAPAKDSKAYLLSYYLQEGYLNLNRGDVVSARGSWQKARMLIDRDNATRNAGKVYHNLAEAALVQGDSSGCLEHLVAARAILRENHDEASLAEIDLIELLSEFYSGECQEPERLVRQTGILISKNCGYYSVLCLFHGMIHSQTEFYGQILDVARPLRDMIRRARPPLFRAVSCLLDAFERHEGEKTMPVMPWKEAFAILLGGQQKFLALLVGVKIAGLYTSTSNSKHAKKFLMQSLRLAETLGNGSRVRSIQRELEIVSRTSDNSARLIDSFHGVSEILNDLDDYRQSLQRLIRFAVDQTGAERGVIFLKARDGADLSVAASLNCDDKSLSDIRDFSMSVPHATMKEASPLVIENALDDRRTNQYDSIVVHNILSVICVPLSHNGEALGALYLDHHTIPALFDKEDLTYISSLANFISVTLTTAQDIRTKVLSNLQMQQDLSRLGDRQTFVTQDKSLLSLFKTLPQVAATKAPVLILGESGTGKEILGHMIHNYSPRVNRPLVKLNCAAIAGSLIESELFGIARNAATDVNERDGRFAAADGGTLYLDEIGDMPQAVQAKVLRVLEYQQFEKVGSTYPIHTDIRFVYATNKNLPELVARREFREDLLYRINTITIEIPPLRNRPGDIPLLIDHFVLIFSEGKAAPRFSTAAVEALTGHHWPGNVRELKNLIERYCILHPGSVITKEMLPPELKGPVITSPNHKKALEVQEAERILKALVDCLWNQSKAAEVLGMPVSTLRRKMKKYGIHRPK